MSDITDWVMEVEEGAVGDIKDWTVATEGGGSAGYASLTGTGETDANGDLSQNGGLSVGQLSPNNDTTTEIFTNFTNIFSTNSFFTSLTYPAMTIEDTSANSGNPNGDPSLVIQADNNPVRIIGGQTTSSPYSLVDVGGGDSGTISLTVNSTTATQGLLQVAIPNIWLGVLHSNGWGTINAENSRTTTTEKISFFGVAPVAIQSVNGSRGGNAALASLLTALHNYGLIIDNSTP